MGHGKQRRVRATKRVGGEAHELVKLLGSLATSRSMYDVWRDWITCMALAIANGVEIQRDRRAAREKEYAEVIGRYPAEAKKVFSTCMGMLVDELETDPRDVLGDLYMALELGNDHAGQFFTPFSICTMIAKIQAGESGEGSIAAVAKREGFVTVSEPAIGGGAMVIAFALAARSAGVEPTTHMHVTGVDVDRKVLMSAYVQLSLLGIPAILIWGNSLTLEEHEQWFTPMHVWGGWGIRLRLRQLREYKAASCPGMDAPAT